MKVPNKTCEHMPADWIPVMAPDGFVQCDVCEGHIPAGTLVRVMRYWQNLAFGYARLARCNLMGANRTYACDEIAQARKQLGLVSEE